MKKIIKWCLQMFADTAINVNTTTGTAEPYKGTTTTNTNLSAEDKTWYETELLENARPELFYQQFAKKILLPAHHGRTVEVRRPNKLPNATVLTEGVVPDGTQFGVSDITDNLKQVGMFVAVSDLAALHSVDPLGQEITEELGASMGKTWDCLTRDDAIAGTNVMYADKDVSGAATEVNSRKNLDATARLTSEMVARAATALKKTDTPKINGKYVAIIHPSVAHDLRRCEEWIEVHKYSATTEIFNGEIGELHGVRFCESTNAKIIKDNTCPTDLAVYPCLFFGKDAYGTVDPEGGGARMIIKSEKEVGGPLEQFGTFGYKGETNGAVILYQERMVRLECCSRFSSVDAAN